MPYIANTDADRRAMLDACGFSDLNAMWAAAGVHSPAPELSGLPPAKSEYEVTQWMKSLAAKNATGLHNFLGAGYYDHIIPAAVNALASRGEFLTAYTPYQPEASQGTLQAIYEFQTAICRLTAMEVANASLYDGGTALFEAMMMAVRITKRRQVVISSAVSPIFRRMIDCYCRNLNLERLEIAVEDNATSSNLEQLTKAISQRTACVIVQYPNFFGELEDLSGLTAAAHEQGALALCSTYPVALSVALPPGEMGFDIVTGEGQSLGNLLSFGGPYFGFMAVRQKHLHRMPGRIVGRTVDREGNPGFVLTLQAREQHIRREQATSNICSNENLCALQALIYLSLVGKSGFEEVGRLCMAKAAFCREVLTAIPGVRAVGTGNCFNEFTIELPQDAAEVTGRLIDKGFAPGFPLGRYYPQRRRQLLVAVTEKRTREEIKALATALEAVL